VHFFRGHSNVPVDPLELIPVPHPRLLYIKIVYTCCIRSVPWIWLLYLIQDFCILRSYIHVIYIMSHATGCHVQLHKFAVACVSCNWILITKNSCETQNFWRCSYAFVAQINASEKKAPKTQNFESHNPSPPIFSLQNHF
jgi:hypothetical protein